VIRLESRTIAQLEELLGEGFLAAVDHVLTCRGMVIVTGMGKAGLVGTKVSATFASTGTPSIALHPTEAMHGDMGRIRRDDVVLALSNSGETDELLALLPHVRRIGASIIAMTGERDSALARQADAVLDIGRVDEACPLGLAPTASTSAMLALGDALAMVVLRERGFSREDYARFHPSGSLGRRLMSVGEVMRQGAELPLAPLGTPVAEVLHTMTATKGRPGAALIVDEAGILRGIFTDGDLRRLLEVDNGGRLDRPVDETMGRDPKSISPDALVDEAERLLREHQVDQIPVVDEDGRPVGLLDIQDLLHTRL
jgi:arabinose-5-phosphate isomerase